MVGIERLFDAAIARSKGETDASHRLRACGRVCPSGERHLGPIVLGAGVANKARTERSAFSSSAALQSDGR